MWEYLLQIDRTGGQAVLQPFDKKYRLVAIVFQENDYPAYHNLPARPVLGGVHFVTAYKIENGKCYFDNCVAIFFGLYHLCRDHFI